MSSPHLSTHHISLYSLLPLPCRSFEVFGSELTPLTLPAGPTNSAPTSLWPGARPSARAASFALTWPVSLAILHLQEAHAERLQGTGTLESALHYLDYLNGTSKTYWAEQRRKNGHPEPYGVKYIAL